MKEHITEAMAGVCARVDVIEAEAKERDAAQTNHAMQLQGVVREIEARCQADVQLHMQYLEQMREKNRELHEGIMRHFSGPPSSMYSHGFPG